MRPLHESLALAPSGRGGEFTQPSIYLFFLCLHGVCTYYTRSGSSCCTTTTPPLCIIEAPAKNGGRMCTKHVCSPSLGRTVRRLGHSVERRINALLYLLQLSLLR